MPKMTFEQWMARLDRQLSMTVGCTSDDLPDQCYHDWWSDELSTGAAMAQVLENLEEEGY